MLISIRAFSQLSTFDSNTGSGNIFESKNNGIAKILDYDVSKTEVGFTLQNAKRSGRKVGVWAADVSFGLDKQTFLLLDKNGINPGASIAGGYSRKYDISAQQGFKVFLAHLKTSSTRAKNAIVTNDTLLKIEKSFSSDIQLNLGLGFVRHKQWNPIQGRPQLYIFDYSLGFNAFFGYNFNSNSSLDEIQICSVPGARFVKESDSTYYSKQECETAFDGESIHSEYLTIAALYKKNIKWLSKSDNSEYLTFIAIPKVTFKKGDFPSYNLSMGIGLNKFPRTVTTSFLLSFNQIGDLAFKSDKEFEDILGFNVYFGIPLGN